jgi:D-alanyl-lipoteichoic acid acyltransferase DltB (MBOAT superfamily)
VLSGPIERFSEFGPHLEQRRTPANADFRKNLVVIVQGLVRKIVIADLLFIIIPLDLFKLPQNFSPFELIFWLPVTAFAIYNDFAGYSAIARGVSGLFGIPLVINFNTPFLSRSFREFWQRWHISLSDWLRDYVYMPVSRFLIKRNYGRNHIFTLILPPMATMLASGAWHGLSWNLFLWGALGGTFLVVERWLTLRHPARPINSQPRWQQVGATLVVFSLSVLTLVPFSAALPVALRYWQRMLSMSAWTESLQNWASVQQRLPGMFFGDILVLLSLSLFLDMIQAQSGEHAALHWSPFRQALAINFVLLALVAASLAQNVPPPFVYQAF